MISRSLPTHPQQTKWQKHRTCLWISTLRAHDHVGFCAHLTECLQGLLKAQQPCPMPLPSLVRPGQAQPETLRPFKKKCETPSGELRIFFSCNKCPLGVLARIPALSLSPKCEKLWQEAKEMMVPFWIWGFADAWLTDRKRRGLSNRETVVSLYFPINAWIANITLLICDYLIWNAF